MGCQVHKPKAARVPEHDELIVIGLKCDVIMGLERLRRIVVDQQSSRHAEVHNEDQIGFQDDQNVFGTPFDRRDSLAPELLAKVLWKRFAQIRPSLHDSG